MGDNFQRGSVIFLFRNKTLPFPLPGAQAGFLRAVNTPHRVQWGAATRGPTLSSTMLLYEVLCTGTPVGEGTGELRLRGLMAGI